MDKFDKVIGYDDIKVVLRRYCDVFKNLETYKQLGVKTPRGILLYGDPGLGKSLLAKCFIEATGLKTYTIRKERPDGEFINYIKDTFNDAKDNAPAIVFLDDMDKFANEDVEHRDAEEYVAIQACIDDCRDSDVFVIATVNDKWCLPDSLIRVGRFDKDIEVNRPEGEDAVKILSYYIKQKKNVNNVDAEEIAKILGSRSCAELENVINEAGIYAGYENKEYIDNDDMMKACMELLFGVPQNATKVSIESLRRIAIHECGHVIIGEVLNPGSINFVALGTNYQGSNSGVTIVQPNNDINSKKKMETNILISLAGKAAVEIITGELCMGIGDDIEDAYGSCRQLIDRYVAYSFDDYQYYGNRMMSEVFLQNLENKTAMLLSEMYEKAKSILLDNKDFLELMIEELMNNGRLSYKDIKRIRCMCN